MVAKRVRSDGSDEPATPAQRQRRIPLQRFLLQVDRQTKETFATFVDAEKVGLAIKTAHPIVQVSIYDSLECRQSVLSVVEAANSSPE
jgi:hypothetical protein